MDVRVNDVLLDMFVVLWAFLWASLSYCFSPSALLLREFFVVVF